MGNLIKTWIAVPVIFTACLSYTFGAGTLADISSIQGDYLEVRSCDIYTGTCFANGEMGIGGTEAIMVWAIQSGEWQGQDLAGLQVIAVIKTDETMGNLRYQPRNGKATLIIDSTANKDQQLALTAFVKKMAGSLVKDIVKIHNREIQSQFTACSNNSCASVKAEGLVDISTRCLGIKDHICGNEEVYYPPLTATQFAVPGFTELSQFQGDSLDVTWSSSGQRSAFIGKFSI